MSELVFVYGTLTDPDRAATVLESDADPVEYGFRGRATLEGLRRVEGTYPTLAPGGSVDGRLLAVDEAGLAALDAYEGVDRGLYVRVRIPFAGDARDDRAWTYVGDPARLEVADEVTWPGDPGAFADRVRTYVARRNVVVRSRE